MKFAKLKKRLTKKPNLNKVADEVVKEDYHVDKKTGKRIKKEKK